jgi:hypothetical protein
VASRIAITIALTAQRAPRVSATWLPTCRRGGKVFGAGGILVVKASAGSGPDHSRTTVTIRWWPASTREGCVTPCGVRALVAAGEARDGACATMKRTAR